MDNHQVKRQIARLRLKEYGCKNRVAQCSASATLQGMKQIQHYPLIAAALHWLVEHRAQQPSLDMLAEHLGYSPSHVQRIFQRWAGVSPKQFVKYLSKQEALARLEQGQNLLEATLESGLSSPGRLHDLIISTTALTPGEARQRGRGVQLYYGTAESPFGAVFLAWTERGLSFLGFTDETGGLQALQKQWPAAEYHPAQREAADWAARIFSTDQSTPLPVWLHGSPFQLKVWEGLLQIPTGHWTSYGQLARLIGQPGASRAVGSAVGSNSLAYLIPCHRVIRSLGEIGGYRWGTTVKSGILGYEAALTPLQLNPA